MEPYLFPHLDNPNSFRYVQPAKLGDLDMLRILGFGLAMVLGCGVAAEEDYCQVLYDNLKAQVTGDPSKCIPVLEDAKPFEQCTKPHSYNGDRETSHVVLILDASGSMAGRVNGDQKMDLAKREAGRFMRDLAGDLPVGLMVYGHKGSNKEEGKAESCAGVDWAVPVGKSRGDVSKKIADLGPTGWTPLAGALDFAATELGNMPPVKEGADSTPVVYLISDGEETCGGDPVGSAKALHEAGVKATVHVIGFDVDDETRTELEAIAEAGGGAFYPAKDAQALREHLNAAKDAEWSQVKYRKCIYENEHAALLPYHKAYGLIPGCMVRETDGKGRKEILKQVKAFTSEADLACAEQIKSQSYNDMLKAKEPLSDLYKSLVDEAQIKRAEAVEWSKANALPPAK